MILIRYRPCVLFKCACYNVPQMSVFYRFSIAFEPILSNPCVESARFERVQNPLRFRKYADFTWFMKPHQGFCQKCQDDRVFRCLGKTTPALKRDKLVRILVLDIFDYPHSGRFAFSWRLDCTFEIYVDHVVSFGSRILLSRS